VFRFELDDFCVSYISPVSQQPWHPPRIKAFRVSRPVELPHLSRLPLRSLVFTVHPSFTTENRMASTFFSLSTLVTASALLTLVQGSPVPQVTDPRNGQSCKALFNSVQGDTCKSIGGAYGLYDYNIQQANTFLNCNDICTSIILTFRVEINAEWKIQGLVP
jgi:hypothetical protein